MAALKIRFLGLAIFSVLIASCTNVGPTDDPVVRRYSWNHYVGGDDLARACLPGAPETLRLVYNGIYDEQRRTYDFTAQPDGGAMLDARAIGPGDLRQVAFNDALKPWSGQQALYKLDAAEYAGVKGSLAQAGFEGPAPQGLELRGDSFYWTASACRDGQFHFHAWAAPSPAFDRLTFIEALAPFDRTGVAVNPPRPLALPPYGLLFATARQKPKEIPHRFIVGPNGLLYSSERG